MTQRPAIVIDNGSITIKCGFNNTETPTAVFPTLVGTIKHKQIFEILPHKNFKDYYIGNEAIQRRRMLTLRYPLQYSFINKCWDDMEAIWDHIFKNELKIQSNQYNILLTKVWSPLKNPWERPAP